MAFNLKNVIAGEAHVYTHKWSGGDFDGLEIRYHEAPLDMAGQLYSEFQYELGLHLCPSPDNFVRYAATAGVVKLTAENSEWVEGLPANPAEYAWFGELVGQRLPGATLARCIVSCNQLDEINTDVCARFPGRLKAEIARLVADVKSRGISQEKLDFLPTPLTS